MWCLGFFLLQECCLWCVDSCISREKWAARSGKWMNYIKSWSSWFHSIEIRLKVKYTVVHCISSLPEKNGKHFESCTWFSVYFCFSIWLSCNLSVVFGAPRFRFKYKLLKRDEKNVIIISKLNVMTFHWFFFFRMKWTRFQNTWIYMCVALDDPEHKTTGLLWREIKFIYEGKNENR